MGIINAKNPVIIFVVQCQRVSNAMWYLLAAFHFFNFKFGPEPIIHRKDFAIQAK
jgi:hypothetical protein